jgi:hypothetical protein
VVEAYTSSSLVRNIWDGEPSGYAEIRIIGFFLENRLHWQFEVKIFLETDVLGYMFIHIQIKH